MQKVNIKGVNTVKFSASMLSVLIKQTKKLSYYNCFYYYSKHLWNFPKVFFQANFCNLSYLNMGKFGKIQELLFLLLWNQILQNLKNFSLLRECHTPTLNFSMEKCLEKVFFQWGSMQGSVFQNWHSCLATQTFQENIGSIQNNN